MNKTRIDYVDYTWNPITGCSHGCEWCYARRMAKRFGWSFEPTVHPDRLAEPLAIRQPARILTCSMGDLFDPGVPFDDVAHVWKAMWRSNQHTYMILTKRPDRLRRFVQEYTGGSLWWTHVWLGVSVTNQADANERIPLLLQTPAVVRWVSVEPLLGEVDLRRWLDRDHACGCGGVCDPREPCPMRDHARLLHWVVVGAQTGPGAVPPKREWVQSILEQCRAAGVPVFLKRNLTRVWQGDLVQQYPR